MTKLSFYVFYGGAGRKNGGEEQIPITSNPISYHNPIILKLLHSKDV